MKTILISFLSIFLCFCSIVVLAQNHEIKGKVTDINSGEPIIGAHISIVGNVYGTVSDYQGNFVFISNVPPPFELHVLLYIH